MIKPDAYGRWAARGAEIEFFLEYDLGTEALAKLAGKLAGYAALAESTGITTPVLVWLPTARREATARRLLHRTWRALEDPRAVPVATAAAEQLNPHAPHPSPADQVWLPLDTTSATGGGNGRREPHRLPDAWPHVPAPTSPSEPHGEAVLSPQPPPPLMAPAPTPMPPAASRAPRYRQAVHGR